MIGHFGLIWYDDRRAWCPGGARTPEYHEGVEPEFEDFLGMRWFFAPIEDEL